MHKYSIAIRRYPASIGKRTLSIEISFGFPAVFGKRSLADQRVLNMLCLLCDLDETLMEDDTGRK